MTGFDAIGGPDQRPRLIGEGWLSPDDGARAGDRGRGFSGVLSDALLEVDGLAKDTKSKAAALARGEPIEVHDLMIAAGKSEVAFNLMLEMRNKLLEAWQTLERSVV